jgi:hypothetical protein
MLLFSNTAEYGITWDRMDGCANALISLIALDSQRSVRLEYLYVRICCTVLCFIILYCIVSYCAVLYYSVLHCTPLKCTVLYCVHYHTHRVAVYPVPLNDDNYHLYLVIDFCSALRLPYRDWRSTCAPSFCPLFSPLSRQEE